MAAGLGFKTFTTGEVLTAADTNGYLMQGVLVFASAAARDAAITSPQEGQCCYLKDTDAVLTYSGAAWVGFDDSNAIQNSIVNAKGDLIGASANDTPAILSVGANGETLVADSSTSTGLRYQGHIEAGKNFIINGGFDIWQRGTSFASSGSLGLYGADRWVYFRGGGVSAGTFSRQASGLTGFQYAMRVQRNSGDTSTQYLGLFYSGETSDSIKFAGKTVTLSFYARAGANYSAASSQLRAILASGTGTDQPVYSYTGGVLDIDQNATLTTSWQRFSYNVTLSSSITELGVEFVATPVGTAGAADYFDITGVQVELGSVATTFSRAGGTIQGERSACERYYQRRGGGSAASASVFGLGFVGSVTTVTAITVNDSYPTMRTAPSFSYSGTVQINEAGSNRAVTSIGANYLGISAGFIDLVVSGGGMTAGRAGGLIVTSDANAYIEMSAEL